MKRTATCVCGQLRVTVVGEPRRINICSCKDCQKRSGSAFQLGAIFDDSQLEAIDGEAKSYARTSDAGRVVELHFCPTCGVSVYFRAEARPSMIGVHAGCFADPGFPAPTHAVWTESRHHWLTLPEVEHSFERQAP